MLKNDFLREGFAMIQNVHARKNCGEHFVDICRYFGMRAHIVFYARVQYSVFKKFLLFSKMAIFSVNSVTKIEIAREISSACQNIFQKIRFEVGVYACQIVLDKSE